MPEQLSIAFDVEQAPRTWPELPCAFGNLRGDRYRHHCADCEAEVERGCTAFAAAVVAGTYNWRGYTQREWKTAGYPPEEWANAKRLGAR